MPTTDTTLSDTLFDLAIGDDEPRARKSDPETSHLAADDSRKNQRIVQDAVFGHLLLAPSTDEELTDWYFSTPGLPAAHRDSPRKRRSDLAKAGKLLATTVQRSDLNGFAGCRVGCGGRPVNASKTDNRVFSHAAPTDLRWLAVRDDDADAIMNAAAERTVVRFAGDAATVVLAALFGQVDHGPKKRDINGRWPSKAASA